MCGIAGIFHYADPHQVVDPNLLARITRTLIHRGPDAEGFHVDGPLGLGHRRLSIVDLTPTGAQPMSTVDGSCWISYNGEFYNHADFRPRLKDKGVNFRGTSDTETLLYLLQSSGPEALADVAGIFAFAYWDSRSHTLTLARDPLGVKQLYYHDDGKRIVFASEIKALLECPDVPRSEDPEAINQYLHFHTPLFDRTFFRNIRQVRPGEFLQITRKGVSRRTYWQLESSSPLVGDPEELVSMLHNQLTKVVGDQLMSDVPVGAFLSGGIDSSAVASFAARAGKPPHCFGVHFSGQGVIDERPYQEAAAKAIGLELDLITLDGSTFPEDLLRLMQCQDEPVIGSAMFPMYHVSRLASRKVKVCLGGQAADEIFGGYARYALVRPGRVLRSWLSGRAHLHATASPEGTHVGGNLWKQATDVSTLRRIARSLRHPIDWKARFFDNFAPVPEELWKGIFDATVVSRSKCRDVFRETLSRSPFVDPGTSVMHWDLQTYLPGLFQQDDRMSMAHGLESRVPLADPRLVRFAFRLGFDMKFRDGASKWILRRAVADAIPESVLNRRKVGFDTPAESWMRGQHSGFVRDLLLSTEAKRRGFWNAKGLRNLVSNKRHPHWFDMAWKAVCVEAWARTFLDRRPVNDLPRPVEVRESSPANGSRIRESVQEVRELGLGNTMFRTKWEVMLRSGLMEVLSPRSPATPGSAAPAAPSPPPLFTDPHAVVKAMGDHVPAAAVASLKAAAQDASRGRILCFGRWPADFGSPIDWTLNPVNGCHWESDLHWSKALRSEESNGDIKLSWEAARFPQAYHLLRAAAFGSADSAELFRALAGQIRGFITSNPFGRGIHWNSGQEVAIRLMSWTFAMDGFERLGRHEALLKKEVAQHALEVGTHIRKYIDYARRSVYNNHLLAEAVGLLLAARHCGSHPAAASWKRDGVEILTEHADLQIARDGGYIQNSHNYHRAAMQYYLWALALLKVDGGPPPDAWRKAMTRSLDFLLAHQNPVDGRLPNYGANDGALPSILSTCDYSDFRPTLQALSTTTRGERLFPPGPWDEEALWFRGPEIVGMPTRTATRTSVLFGDSGYSVLKGHEAGSFGTFRCGNLRDRFSQIDMLHLDVWWKGLNILTDPGSYLYNGARQWHDHFFRTAGHNTVEIDGRDQMLHWRRFKCLYWTRAKMLRFEDRDAWCLAEGEHYGYRARPGGCVHRRSVLFAKDDLWIVVDQITGNGRHSSRLHWLCDDFPFEYSAVTGSLELSTSAGLFGVGVMDGSATPLAGSVVRGESDPPRGWLSRYYGEKKAVPSLAVTRRSELPATFVSVLGAGRPKTTLRDGQWSVQGQTALATFRIKEGRFTDVETQPRS